MMLEDSLARKLSGRKLTDADAARLHAALGPKAMAIVSFMQRYPVMGACFTLSEQDDESGLGVEMQWMQADQMISEAIEAHPGLEALTRGYFPIGACLTGSGDYYFLDMNREAPRVVRIVHTAAVGGTLNERQVEQVASSIDAFIARAAIEPE